MFELTRNDEIQKLINVTKSDSGISGPDLAEAHIKLGRMLSREIHFPPEDTTVVAVMRGGLFFAEGMYLEMGCKFETYDPKHQEFIRPQTKHVIVVDSVINTGETIQNILEPDMTVACCVINANAVRLFENQLYTVRVSQNSFVGGNTSKQSNGIGPDTTMRLFNQL